MSNRISTDGFPGSKVFTQCTLTNIVMSWLEKIGTIITRLSLLGGSFCFDLAYGVKSRLGKVAKDFFTSFRSALRYRL